MSIIDRYVKGEKLDFNSESKLIEGVYRQRDFQHFVAFNKEIDLERLQEFLFHYVLDQNNETIIQIKKDRHIKRTKRLKRSSQGFLVYHEERNAFNLLFRSGIGVTIFNDFRQGMGFLLNLEKAGAI